MIISKKHLNEISENRPIGFFEDVIYRSKIRGDSVEIDDQIFDKICHRYKPMLPNLRDMATNFIKSIQHWARSGFKVATNNKFASRLGICRSCPNWKDNRCMICGCYQLKLWLDTEKCPENRWE